MKIEDIIQFLIFGSETCNKVTLDKEDVKTLLDYITTLQRKEYNNSKAIEYIENNEDFETEIFDCNTGGCLGTDLSIQAKILLNILEKGEYNEK